MDQSEFTRLFVSKDTRAMVHRLKGPERTYDQFIAELCRDYEHRLPNSPKSEAGTIIYPSNEERIN